MLDVISHIFLFILVQPMMITILISLQTIQDVEDKQDWFLK